MANSDRWIPMPRFLLRKSAVKHLMKHIVLKNKNILEFGFGAGEMLRWFHSKGAKPTGVDFSLAAVNMAKQRLGDIGLLSDIELLSNTSKIPASSMDVVCAFEVLEHIQDDSAALIDWMTFLKPGGSLILSVPAHMTKWNESDEWAGHYRRYEKMQLKALFKEDRYETVNLWNYGFPLSLLLDKFLGSSKKEEVRNLDGGVEKETLSKKSGTERQNKLIYRLISNNFVLFPFYLLQKFFFRKDIGSGYLIHVIKHDKK